MAEEINLTESQREAVESNESNILCVASPGAGKTRVMIARIERLVAEGTPPGEICAITFTNVAAAELLKRLAERGIEGIGYCGTLHAFALRAIRSEPERYGYRPGLAIFPEEERDDYLRDSIKRLGYKSKTSVKKVLKERDGTMPKTGYVRPEQLVLQEFYRRLRESNMIDLDRILPTYLARLEKSGSAGRVAEGISHLMVDEFQDSNPIDDQIYTALPCGNKFFVGDPDQCQPAGTMVRLSSGSEVPIEKVKKGDCVVSYARHEKAFIRSCEVTEVSRRIYCGPLYKISCNGLEAECTENHKWLIKWPSGKDRNLDSYCVYMMRKGDWFRVGKTRLFRSGGGSNGGILGVALRMRQEDADQAWILSIHPTEEGAVTEEAVIAANYGIPQTCFKTTENNTHFNQKAIIGIYSRINGLLKRAVSCLNDFGRDVQHPLFCKTQPRTRRTVQEIHACNLIDGVMFVPVHPGEYDYKNSKGNWMPISVTRRHFNGEVFSLNVDRHGRYVSNGIVTCNSIYQFRGGSIGPILERSGAAETRLVELNQNFRSTPEICRTAQALIEHNQNRVDKKMVSADPDSKGYVHCEFFESSEEESGAVLRQIESLIAQGESAREIAVLARTNHIAREFSLLLRKTGVPVSTRVDRESEYPDLGKALMALELLHDPDNDLLAEIWIRRDEGRLQADQVRRKATSQGAHINEAHLNWRRTGEIQEALRHLMNLGIPGETVDHIESQALEAEVLGGDLMELVAKMRLEQGGSHITHDGVSVGTVHGAKGREFDRVFILGLEEEVTPAKNDVEDERRIVFVGVTRARKHLNLSWARKRTQQWGGVKESEPSRFLEEMQIKEG